MDRQHSKTEKVDLPIITPPVRPDVLPEPLEEAHEDYFTLGDDTAIKLAPPDAVVRVKLKLKYKGEGPPLRVDWDDILID